MFWAGALPVPYLDPTTALIAIIAGSLVESDNAIPSLTTTAFLYWTLTRI